MPKKSSAAPASPAEPVQRPLMDVHAVAGRCGVSPGSIMRWVNSGRFPKPIVLSPQVHRWRTETVEAHLVSRDLSLQGTDCDPEATPATGGQSANGELRYVRLKSEVSR